MFDPVHDPGRIAVFDVGLNELLEFQGIGLEEDRGTFDVIAVEGMGDHAIVIVVVQIGTWEEPYLFFLNGLVKIFKKTLVRPGLVGGMEDLGRAMLEPGDDDCVTLS